jgi:ferredoxin
LERYYSLKDKINMPTVLLVATAPNEKDKKAEVNQGQLIFDELESQNIQLPHGCLAGSCGVCRIEILEGENNLSPQSTVETDTILAIKKNYHETNRAELVTNKCIRLSCRARVMGDVKISLLK